MIFGVSIYEMMGLSVDRPIHALLNLKGDVEEAERSQDYKLEQYLENFRAPELFDGMPGAGDAGRAGALGGTSRDQQTALLAGQGQTGAAATAGGKAKQLRDTSGTAGGLGRDRATAATEAQRDASDRDAGRAGAARGDTQPRFTHQPGLPEIGEDDDD